MRNEDKSQKLREEIKQEEAGESQRWPTRMRDLSTKPRCLEILREKGDLMEEILSRDNMFAALKRVQANKGCAGEDGMQVGELGSYLKVHWPRIRTEILEGRYKPRAIKQVEIPKSSGGKRKLSVPSVLERLIQQALMQTLQSYIDESFSRHSYGFRPGRSAHQALRVSKGYIEAGQ